MAEIDPAAITRKAMAFTRGITEGIGPRRPTSPAERRAHEWLRAELERRGLQSRLEDFRGFSTFAWPNALSLALLTVTGVLRGRARRVGSAMSAAVGAATLAEGGIAHAPVSDLVSWRRSQNLVAEIPSSGSTERTVCLMCHIDSSRSGLMFRPWVARRLVGQVRLQALAVALLSADGLLRRSGPGCVALRAARLVGLMGLGVLAERELFGEDVPGANDNASGCGAAAAVCLAVAQDPFRSTRVVLLCTGCEEAGLLGSRAFLRRHDTADWLFLNLDGVGARATLRYLPREGLVQTWPADPGLVDLAERVAGSRPELGLKVQPHNAGLTYDATPVLARGGRALTLSAQDATIPEYHQPTDTFDRLEERTMRSAVAVVLEMLARIEAGEVGPQQRRP